MNDYIFHLIFVFISLIVLIKTIFYGIYEIKTEHNKSGGISVIIFSILVIAFSNIVMIYY